MPPLIRNSSRNMTTRLIPLCLLFIWSFMTFNTKTTTTPLVVDAFLVVTPPPPTRRSTTISTTPLSFITTKSTTALSMCICIDCKFVTSCSAYHFVETKHEQPHMTENPTFEPEDGSPTIHVNVRTIRNTKDQEDEAQRMWKEHEAETQRAEQKQKEQKQDNKEEENKDDDDQAALVGETVYDFAPVTTYEYDVVKCASFVEDQGAWIRNMPEEIKRANPDFVPS